LTTIGWPKCSESRNELPSRVSKEKSGAGLPTRVMPLFPVTGSLLIKPMPRRTKNAVSKTNNPAKIIVRPVVRGF